MPKALSNAALIEARSIMSDYLHGSRLNALSAVFEHIAAQEEQIEQQRKDIERLIHDQITIMQKPDGRIIVTSAKGDYDVEMIVTRAFAGLLSTIMTRETGEGYQANIRLIPDHDEPLPFSPLDESETR